MGALVIGALLLIAPTARAECAKATVMRPCSGAKQGREGARRAEPRSPGLVVGGIGVMLLAIPSTFLAFWGSTPCSEYTGSPCSSPYLWHGVLLGVGSLAGGSAMVYYGALDAPQPKQPNKFPSPLSSNGFTLRIRF